MSAVLAIAWRLLKITVPVPLALIGVLWLWAAIDKSSAVRRAVNASVTRLVAATEIAAAQTRAASAEALLADAIAANQRLNRANDQLGRDLARIEDMRKEADDAIEDMGLRHAGDACRLDRALVERLRNR
jgi:hypothetical protein